MNLAKQYNKFADSFSKYNNSGKYSNCFNRKLFYSHINFIKPGMRLLDLACGDGTDLIYYKELGADIYGLDASEEMIKIAKQKLPNADLQVGLFEKTPFKDKYFDIVLSKYAIQTSADMEPVFEEIHRILKPGGIMMYLVVHPFRQFFEKKDKKADYFVQKIVKSNILGDTVTVEEPSHTMKEYLSVFLFKNFDVQSYDESFDPAAELIDEKKYPAFLIIKAIKR